jgi:hypothetical protein
VRGTGEVRVFYLEAEPHVELGNRIMRTLTGLGGVVLIFALTGCSEAPNDPDGPGTPGPPVPLKEIVFSDLDGLYGGEQIWVSADGTAYTRVVSMKKEKRYKRQITAERWAEIERLVGAHHVLGLQERPFGTGVPHESMYSIRLVTKDGRKISTAKWARDKRPRFDPLMNTLLGTCRAREAHELIYEGENDYKWTPDGFEKLW